MEKASVEIESKLDSCLGCCLSIDDTNRSFLIFSDIYSRVLSSINDQFDIGKSARTQHISIHEHS